VKIIDYIEVTPVNEVPGVAKYDVITAADGAPNFCMRVFEVQPGSSTPSHTHYWEHEIFVISGKGSVVSETGSTDIGKGSVIFIPPNENHCLVNKGNEQLRFICLIPVLPDQP
jgi:quercetin dioxygenase-like cupin family protein